MANCTDCDNYFHCYLVEDGAVDVDAENREKDCSGFVNCLKESNMADNDRFVIQKVEKTKCAECKFKKYEVCERDENGFMLCPITNKTVSETVKLHRGKTRAEYEDMIAKALFDKKLNKSGRELENHTIGEVEDIKTKCKEYAKAVIDRLFGEGE